MKKSKDCKKLIFGTCLLLIAIFVLSIVAFNGIPIVKNYDSNAVENIESLATTTQVNSPTIHAGTAKYYSASTNSSSRNYSTLTTSADSSHIGAEMTVNSNGNRLSLTMKNADKWCKSTYFDFYTNLVVPAYTEYQVTYRISYDISKMASAGSTAKVIAKLYDFGSVLLNSSGAYRNAENLYRINRFDLPLTAQESADNDYWINGEYISTSATNEAVSATYSFSIVHTNNSNTDMVFRHDYGYYGFLQAVGSGNTPNTRMEADVSVTATIKQRSLCTPSPEDVNTQYTGQSLSLDNIVDSQKTWYDASIMDLDYSANADMINAGTKRVKAIIKTEARNDENKFSGEIGEGEDEYSRYFNFVIEPKKIKVIVAKDTSGLPVVSLDNTNDIYTGDDDINGRAPNLGFNYTNSGGYNSTVMPTKVDTYTATAIILNTDTCKNYVLDGTYSTTFTVNKVDVSLPSISGVSTKEYTGAPLPFTISGGDNPAIKITPPSGMTVSGNTLTATKAGKYRVMATLADNGESTQWPDGSTGAQYYDYEITKKPIGITITCSATSATGAFEWNVGDTPTFTIKDESCANDTLELYVYYIDSTSPSVKHDSINSMSVKVDDKTRTITMPNDLSQGSYTICVELNGSDNDNYTLDATKTATFTIKGSKVNIDASKIIWKYNDITITDTSNVKLVYNGNAYQFSVDTNVLRANGAKVDITRGTNGYDGDVSVINAKTSYAVTVYITNYDNSYEAHSSQYTLNYSIDKAKYDLSGISWGNKKKEYNGTAQSIELVGTLPQGLTVASYSGNNKVVVGDYTTTVRFNVSNTDNYYVPTKGATDTYDGEFEFDVDWSIVKAILDIHWSDPNTGESGVYKLPTVKSIGNLNVDSMVDYVYYDSEGNAVTSLPMQTTTVMQFRAVATLKSNYAQNYEIKKGTEEHSFEIGKDMYPVTLILKWNGMNVDDAQFVYTGQAIAPTIEIIQGTVTASNIVITYSKGGVSVAEPITVGHYKVDVTLDLQSRDLHYLTSDSMEFEFDIIQADFDVSGLIWAYAHGDVTATYDTSQGKWIDASGSEIVQMTYDKTPHTLTLVGKDGIDGLAINVSDYEYTDAGNYTAKLNFTYDTENYNAPNFASTLVWSVAKATIDTSGVVWGYSVGVSEEEIVYTENLKYTRVESGEVKYTVKLINLPNELKDFIDYRGTKSTSGGGSYNTTYFIKSEFDTNNYETLVMPSGLLTKLDWEVEAKKLEKPVFDNSWSAFDGEVHDFAVMFGITDADWKLYIKMIITKDGEDYLGLSDHDYDYLTDKEFKAINSGEYLVKFEIIEPNSDDGVADVWWIDRPEPTGYIISVSKYVIDIEEWQGATENATVNLPTWVRPFIAYKITDNEGKVVNSNDMQLGKVYTKEVCTKAGYEKDIEITGKKTLSVSLGKLKVAKPTFDEEKIITYDGNVHTIEEYLKKAVDTGVILEVDELLNAGEYEVTIRLDGEVYTWNDGTSDSYTYTVKIGKATIGQNALQWTIDENGLPKLTVRGHSDIAFKYTYIDADGFGLTLAEIQDGMEYVKVVARIDNENYDIIDTNKEVVEEVEYTPIPQEDPPVQEPAESGADFGKVLEILKQWWQVIASVGSIVLIVVFMSKGISYANKKKQAKNTIKNKYTTAYYGATGLFGLAMSSWTAIACVLLGLLVLSLVFMIIEKIGYNKAIRELEDAKDEYLANKAEIENKQRNDQMQMMLMGLLGGNGGGQGGAVQQGISADEMRYMINDAMTNMLPQQASNNGNDELIQKLIAQNEKSEERIEKLMKQLAEQQPTEKVVEKVIAREVATANANDETIKSIIEGQKVIMQKLAEQQPVEKVVAREVAVANANDETIKQILKNQEVLMQQIAELSAKQNVEPQIIEKVVEKEVKVEVPVEVEKIVEKEVIKEVPVEKVVVEKVVEKEVKAEKPKKEVAPRLTLEDAYAKLTKTQQKFFDGLKEYALSKDAKCKEKPSTYFTVIGTSTTNPLIKLTIKKNTTVAMFKLEDEFTKDIRKNATSDGTKVKVKETEIIVSDAQAFKTAKDMVDLREDQIERYQDLLKEQRSMKKR